LEKKITKSKKEIKTEEEIKCLMSLRRSKIRNLRKNGFNQPLK